MRLFVALCLCGLAPGGPPPTDEYAALLEAARADPAHADFPRLRDAYTRTALYQPDSPARLDLGPVEQELRNGERAAALQALDRVFGPHWMDLTAHAHAADVCDRVEQPDRARQHRLFLRGLTNAILGAGDGRGFETAWPVLDRTEEDWILARADLGGGRRTVVQREGHWYDVVRFQDDESGRDVTFYFNIDAPQRWREAQRPGARPGP
jgi:hypothetical protein